MYKKILVPLDGSELAEQAIEHAIALANAFEAEVYLLQVVMHMVGSLAPYEVEYQLGESFRQAALQEAHEYLNRMSSVYSSQLNKTLHTKVVEGIVVDGVLEYAEFQNIDLIVMATHGRSGVSRWVFGSVAERVLRAANCPIFLVRVAKSPEQN